MNIYIYKYMCQPCLPSPLTCSPSMSHSTPPHSTPNPPPTHPSRMYRA